MKKAIVIVCLAVVPLLTGCAGLAALLLWPFYDPWHVSKYEHLGLWSGDESIERMLARYPEYAACDVVISAFLRGAVHEVYEVSGPFTLKLIARRSLESDVALTVDSVEFESSLGREHAAVSESELPAESLFKRPNYHNPAPGSEHENWIWAAPSAIDAAPEDGEVITALVRVTCYQGGVARQRVIEFRFEPKTVSGLARLP